jgi:hypothetical protein
LASYGLVLTAINIVALLVTLGMTYYAIRLVMKFRRGMLEKPWRHVSFGAISLTAAGIIFAVRSAIGIPASLSSVLLYGGSILSVIGGLFLLFGLRAENQVWTAKEKGAVLQEQQQRRKKDLMV